MLHHLNESKWQASWTIKVYEVIFQIRTDDQSFEEKINSWLPATRSAQSNDKIDFVLSFVFTGNFALRGFYRNDELVMRFTDEIPAHQENVLRTKILFSIAEHAKNFVFLHAGAVAFEEKVILLIGASRTGKTTLTVDFVRSGAKYFTDDCAVVDRDAQIYPLPKPLSIRNEFGVQTDYPIETIGGKSCENQLSIALLLFVEYNPKTVWTPRPLTVGQITFKLMQNVFYSQAVRKNPSIALFNLQQLAQKVTAFESQRADTQAVIKFSREFFGL